MTLQKYGNAPFTATTASAIEHDDAFKRCTCPQHEGPNPLPVSEFDRHNKMLASGQKAAYLASWCKACTVRSVARWRQQNRETDRENSRRWRAENPEKRRAQHRRERDQLRNQVFAHYGRACACCGTTERLTIDHIDGRTGNQHLMSIGGPGRYYTWLIANGFPAGFQTLCIRCNVAKGAGLTCPLDHGALKELRRWPKEVAPAS